MDAKPDPVDSVLSTLEVREMILKKLDILSLVNCRLVTKSWNQTASSILKKRPVWIKRQWDSEKLHQLYRCVKRSTNFPFSRLDLSITCERSENLNFDKVSKLFTRFGTTLTHLRAECSITWQKNMMKNLLKKTAQLQYLELGKLPVYLKTHNPEFCLPSLRVLKFGSFYEGRGERALEQLIRSAPHLKEIQNVHCNSDLQMAAIRSTKTFHLVSRMIISASIDARVCSELTANPPQLTALTVEANQRGTPQFLLALKAVLVQNAPTLNKLKLWDFSQQLDDLPVFHKLEELNFKIDPDRCWRQSTLMSAVVSHLSSSSFPTLKKIRLDTLDAEITEKIISNHFWKVCATPLESVDQLVLESYFGPAVIKYLAKCFPQVTHITVNYQQSKYGRGTDRRDSDIWLLSDFPNLRKLDIHGHPFKYGIMDRFLTGIPCEILTTLRNAPTHCVFPPCVNEILRTHGNILPLKNLKEFTVTIVPSRHAQNPSSEKPFMTMVSIWYALELIPDLRANFLCCSKSLKCGMGGYKDFQKAFLPVKDYVTVGQCFCDED